MDHQEWDRYKTEGKLVKNLAITGVAIFSYVLYIFLYWESPLDCKEIQLVHSEGDQPWDFFGRNDAKAETPVLWPPHAKS